MDILFLGIDPAIKRFFRDQTPPKLSSKVFFHSRPLHKRSLPGRGRWDLIVIGEKVKDSPEIVKSLRSSQLQGLKVVLTDQKSLDSAVGFWGTAVYSYLLSPINQRLWQFTWHNALERVQMARKMSRMRAQKDKVRVSALEERAVLNDLFRAHLKIQELEQERTRFLDHTAHELRSPLTALQGYLALLANEKVGSLSPLQRKVLDQSTHPLQRLLKLTCSLLELDSLTRHSAELHWEQGDLRQCLEASVAERRQDAEAKQVRLSVEYSTDLPQFTFDFERLQQVFVNLVDNAVKFTEPGGRVTIRCTPDFWERRTIREQLDSQSERREQGALIRNNCVRVVVEDDGVGIPPEDMPNIFREYFRGSGAYDARQGFGLGLAVASQIVDAHSGKIWAESKPGQGSRFTVLIPTDRLPVARMGERTLLPPAEAPFLGRFNCAPRAASA